MSADHGLVQLLVTEVLRDAHRYVPGVEQSTPSIARRAGRIAPVVRAARERSRDGIERAAGRLGFSRCHFDPDVAAVRLLEVLDNAEELEATYARLANRESRQALLDVLTLRVLGPYHAQLATSLRAYRLKQRYVDEHLRLQAGTYEVSDPWFSPLSLYRVPLGNESITLHGHSVDIVSVFLLGQYIYSQDPRVRVKPGAVVLDVGGCWGDTALAFAHAVGPRGKVFTFEFDPESLGILRANLELNPELAPRIEIVERALWGCSGETLEFVQAGRMTHLAAEAGKNSGQRVLTMTVDDFAGLAGLDQVNFIKVDVEGAEREVVAGAQRTVTRDKPTWAMAAYHRDRDVIDLAAQIAALDPVYRFYLESYAAVEEETVLFAAV